VRPPSKSISYENLVDAGLGPGKQGASRRSGFAAARWPGKGGRFARRDGMLRTVDPQGATGPLPANLLISRSRKQRHRRRGAGSETPQPLDGNAGRQASVITVSRIAGPPGASDESPYAIGSTVPEAMVTLRKRETGKRRRGRARPPCVRNQDHFAELGARNWGVGLGRLKLSRSWILDGEV
jgi:hypothetical protein